MKNIRTALITGASSGIGKDLAFVFAGNGYDLVLTARRGNNLKEIAKEISKLNDIKISIIPEDLSDRGAPERIYNFCEEKNISIDVLVNNAGYGILGNFHQISWDKHSNFIEVLSTSVIHLTYLFLPKMIDKKFGRIINIASLVGLIPGGGTMYSAAKTMVVKFSQGIHKEYKHINVYCCAVCPGFTHTEFHREMIDVENSIPSIMWMKSKDVAEQSFKASMSGKELLINGAFNRFLVFLVWLTPRHWFINFVSDRLRSAKK